MEAEHPVYGRLEELALDAFWTDHWGVRMVAGYWGPWRIYANLPMSQVQVTA